VVAARADKNQALSPGMRLEALPESALPKESNDGDKK